MAAVRAGDDRAFEQLYLRYQRRISAYIFGMVHDHQRAEDITQDVFMSALRRMRATDQRIIFKPWIYEIAKNACIDAFRRSRRAEEVSYDADESGEQLHLVSNGPTPDAAVDTRMSIDHLRGAFDGLSEAHHQILVMRELEGLSYRQIGEKLGMSRPSVESTLFRARRRLSEEYEELVSGERCQQIQTIIAGANGGQVGTRDERKLGRHVSHCQPCRRAALVAGFDPDTLVPKRTVREKLAGWLPLPAFLKRFLLFGGGDRAATVAQMADSTGAGWVKIAAAASALALAGLGAHTVTSPGKSAIRDGAAPAAAAKATSHTTTTAQHGGSTGHLVTTGSGTKQGAATSGSGAPSGAGGSSGSTSGSSGASGGGSSSASDPAGAASTNDPAGAVKGAVGSGSLGGVTKQVGDTVSQVGQQTKVPTVQLPKVQLPTVQVPSSPGAPPAVKKTVDTVNKTVTGATSTVNNTVGGVTDAANKTVSGATNTVNNTVSGATSTVGGTVTGAGKTADDTTKAAAGTVKAVTGKLPIGG